MSSKTFLLILLLGAVHIAAMAQAIRGEVVSMDDRRPLSEVTIENIHTSLVVTTGELGTFTMAASGGQLLEFKKPGYKVARVRVPNGYIPSYFKIIMQKGIPTIDESKMPDNRYNPHDDSAKYAELYKHELMFPKMKGYEKIEHPFSAMSKRNQEIWQFQDDYTDFQKEKYVDRTFNEAIVTKFTGLTGDSLHTYMRRYRPTYDQLKSMNDYSFFMFIKGSVHNFRSRNTPRNSQ
jgi:hypothetical protein